MIYLYKSKIKLKWSIATISGMDLLTLTFRPRLSSKSFTPICGGNILHSTVSFSTDATSQVYWYSLANPMYRWYPFCSTFSLYFTARIHYVTFMSSNHSCSKYKKFHSEKNNFSVLSICRINSPISASLKMTILASPNQEEIVIFPAYPNNLCFLPVSFLFITHNGCTVE